MTNEIILAGFGGQGILFAGKMLAYSAMNVGKEVSWIPSYGPEMRGGTANCSVIISDDKISSPLISNPDYLIAMNLPSYNKFYKSLKPNGKLFLDSSLINEKCTRNDIECFYVPATTLAIENGLDGMANIILCGKLLVETGIIDKEVIEASLKKIIPKTKEKLIKLNLNAIEIGINIK